VKRVRTIRQVKAEADDLARESYYLCRRAVEPVNPVAAAMIQVNYRFYRRMAGLAGRDATERKNV
jgi:DNA-binding GntR family transcriptional regulator